MKTTFPHIRNISEVLPLIEGRKDFVVAKKDTYTVINYVVMTPETFPAIKPVPNSHTAHTGEAMWAAAMDQVAVITKSRNDVATQNRIASILRELRGLKFDNKTGEVIARPLHKFFNLNERDETTLSPTSLTSTPHLILQKLDGSMIHPIAIPDYEKNEVHLRWATKMGITHTAMNAECFIAQNPQYTTAAKVCLSHKSTPIFEWESPLDQIVVRQTEDKLTLLAIRDNLTGAYLPYQALVEFARMYSLPVVQMIDVDNKPLDKIVDTVRQYEDNEGIIIRFNDGGMIKVKSDWYVQLHRAKDLIRDQRNVVEVILNEKLDDLIPVLDEPSKKAVREFEKRLLQCLVSTAISLEIEASKMKEIYPTKKDFALNEKALPQSIKSAIFALYDDPSYQVAWDKIKTMALRSIQRVESYETFKKTMNLPDLQQIFKEQENVANN